MEILNILITQYEESRNISSYFLTNLDILHQLIAAFYIGGAIFVASAYKPIMQYCYKHSYYIPNIQEHVLNFLEYKKSRFFIFILHPCVILITTLGNTSAGQFCKAYLIIGIIEVIWFLFNLQFLYKIYSNYLKLTTDENNFLNYTIKKLINTAYISYFIADKIVKQIKKDDKSPITQHLCRKFLELYEKVLKVEKLPLTDNEFLNSYAYIFEEYIIKYNDINKDCIVSVAIEIININIKNKIPLKDCKDIVRILENLYLNKSEYLNCSVELADRINKIRKNVINEILLDANIYDDIYISGNKKGILKFLDYAFNSDYSLDFEDYCFLHKMINSTLINSPFNIQHIGSNITKYDYFFIKIIDFIKNLNLNNDLPIPLFNRIYIEGISQQGPIYARRLCDKEFLLRFYNLKELTHEIYKLLISSQLILDTVICIYKFYINNYEKLVDDNIQNIDRPNLMKVSNILSRLREIPIFNYYFFLKYTLFVRDDVLLDDVKEEVYLQIFLALSAVLVTSAKDYDSNILKFNTHEQKSHIYFIKYIKDIINYIESISDDDKAIVVQMYSNLSNSNDYDIENILNKIKNELKNVCNILEEDLAIKCNTQQ